MEKIIKKIEIFRKICPHCGKKIESEFPKQLEYNYNIHLQSCKEVKR